MRFMKAADPRVTFAELQEWPDDGRRYELYDGEVLVVPSPFPRHQRVAINIEEILREYEHATGGLMFHAPLDIVLSEHNVVQPDVVFFRKERRHVVDMMAATRAAPDLAWKCCRAVPKRATAVARCSSWRVSACLSIGSSIP